MIPHTPSMPYLYEDAKEIVHGPEYGKSPAEAGPFSVFSVFSAFSAFSFLLSC
jgi:hypothetical protein